MFHQSASDSHIIAVYQNNLKTCKPRIIFFLLNSGTILTHHECAIFRRIYLHNEPDRGVRFFPIDILRVAIPRVCGFRTYHINLLHLKR